MMTCYHPAMINRLVLHLLSNNAVFWILHIKVIFGHEFIVFKNSAVHLESEFNMYLLNQDITDNT